MASSLQRKLLLPLLFSGLIIAVVGTLIGNYIFRQRLNDYVLNRAETLANSVQFAAETFDKPSEIQRIVSALGGEKGVNLIVVVFGEPARVIASTRSEWLGMPLQSLPYGGVADDLAEAIATRSGHRHIHDETQELDYTVALERHEQGKTHVVSGAAMVHVNASPLLHDVRMNALQQASLTLLVTLLLTLVMWWLIRIHVLRATAIIEHTMQAQAQGQRQAFTRLASDDEIGRVGIALDQLLSYRNDSEKELTQAREFAESSFNEVRAIQQRLQIATRAGRFGIWEWWFTRDELIWDDRMYELFGRSRRDPVSSTMVLQKYLADDERERIMKEFSAAIERKDNGFSQQFIITREDGLPVRLQDEAVFVRDDTGNVQRVIGITWDVSAQYAAQEEQKKLALVAQHASNLIVIYNRDFAIEWANPAFERFTGYSPNEYIGQRPAELLHGPETDLQTIAQMESALAQRAAIHAEIQFYRKNRQPYWVELELLPVMNNGRLERFVSIETVITERIQAQMDLQRSLHELRQQRSALDEHAIVAITDAAGRITYANDKFCAISQFSREELLGQNHRIVNSSHHSRDFWDQFWKTISSGQIWHGTIKNKRKHGEYYWVETTVVPFVNENGKPYQYIALRIDITERVAMEEKLQQAIVHAENANRSKSEFLANMSHEIRTPMNAVLGLSELLRDTPLNDQQRDYVNTIYTAGDALLTIINDILDFSKIEAGKMELSPIAFDLERTLYEIIRMLSIRAQEKNLELILDYDSAVPRRVFADPVRLRQVLLNLLGNAVKFTNQGHVCARARCKAVKEKSAALRLEVEDTGIGIDSKTQATLFQSFTQADASISRQFGGTGLGLAISKRIVELMGGSMGLISSPGKGSTFFIDIELPLAEQQTWQDQHVSLQGEIVWLLEGHALGRLVLERQLTAIGVQVHNIESCDALQRALPKLRHETLIIDGDMAIAADILNWWKAQKPQAALVILASHAMRGDAAPYREIPGCAYLHKPTDRETLRHSLRMVMAARDKKELPLVTKHVVDEAQDQINELQFDATVLVAEDVTANQMVIRAMLMRCNINVEFANNGLDAVMLCKQKSFDMVFMDCQMPVMDGLSATQQIRREQSRHIPIIALTANALQDDRGRCLSAGMDDFLAKPVKRKLLHDILKKWLPDKLRANVS